MVLFLVVGLGIIALGYIFYLFYDFKKGLSNTKSVISRDREHIISMLKVMDLSPWNLDELSLISRTGESNVKKTLFGELEEGVIYSIYHEPILGFVLKSYSDTNKKLIGLKRNKDLYIINVSKDNITIDKNDKSFGTVDVKEKLVLSNSEIGQISIDIHSKGSMIPTVYKEEVVISISTDDTAALDQTRVLTELVKTDNKVKDLFIVGLSYCIIEHLI